MKLFTITFIIVNIALASSSFLNNKNNVFSQIKEIESTDFGKKLMDTIQLQIESKAPLDDVASLLSDLKQNLLEQQDQAQGDNDAYQLNAEQQLADLQEAIDNANTNIQDSTAQLASVNKAIEQNRDVIQNQNDKIAALNSQLQSLAQTHEDEQDAYNARIQEHNSVLAALGVIIPRLQSLQSSGDSSDQDLLLAQLAKIGRSNPIAALVTVATSLDQSALANVIEKLQAIALSVEASLEADTTAQQESDQGYNALVVQINSVITQAQSILDTESAALVDNQNQAQALQQTIDNYTSILASSQQQYASVQSDASSRQAQFESDSEQRQHEVSVVVSVQTIIATRLQNVQTYFLERQRE